MSSIIKCYCCEWEGEEEELAQEPANLMFYDQVLMDSLQGVEVTRVNLICPKCGTMVKSRRLIDGVPYDR